MIQHARRKGQAQIVVGMSALAVATAMLTRLHNDFVSGLVFGIGMGLLMLGIHTMKRHQG